MLQLYQVHIMGGFPDNLLFELDARVYGAMQ
jgi:hypothetical protein